MPILSSDYTAPWYLYNAHLETIIPSIFRKVEGIHYERERIDTPDDDFLDLDWLKTESDRLVIISHGLEGSSNKSYVKGMARIFHEHGWNVLAWNCRSCSEEINKTFRLYHHGASDDLETVIKHIETKYPEIKQLVLIGFSMGGSLTLKYLGENSSTLNKNIKCAVAFSTPLNLQSSAESLSKKGNGFYRRRFLKKLAMKISAKAAQFPGQIDISDIESIKHFRQLDLKYSAPMNGFETAEAFYTYASAENYLEAISVPALIVNAKNDPMLPKACFPVDLASKHAHVFLEIPTKGGHVGFYRPGNRYSWAETRTLKFAVEYVKL